MLTVPTQRILTFGFIAFVLIGLEQGLLGLFVAELGTKLARSPEDLGLFFALHGLGLCCRNRISTYWMDGAAK